MSSGARRTAIGQHVRHQSAVGAIGGEDHGSGVADQPQGALRGQGGQAWVVQRNAGFIGRAAGQRIDRDGAGGSLKQAWAVGVRLAIDDGVALAGVAQYPARVKCALLGWMALTDALAQAGVDVATAPEGETA